ncbi:MAG: hypothetical protein ACYC1C_19850 [Chloroflexota bacterium]
MRGSTGNGAPRPAYINGQEVRDPRVYRLSVYEYANVLGEQGWEIVSSDVEGRRVVFKRGKP